jgi:hypothetical protein
MAAVTNLNVGGLLYLIALQPIIHEHNWLTFLLEEVDLITKLWKILSGSNLTQIIGLGSLNLGVK